MSRTIQQELIAIAGDLRRGETAQTIKRLEDMATAITRDGMVLVLPKTIQTRKNGTPYVTGDMVYLERQEGGGAA